MISVILPTRNRASLLNAALASICNQTLDRDKYEIIVVDNGSSDNTSEIVGRHSTDRNKIQYIYEERPGLHVGRNLGFKLARYENLVFVDDDIQALPCWLESINQTLENENVGLVAGNNYPFFEVPPPSWVLSLWNKKNKRGYSAISQFSIVDFGRTNGMVDPGWVWGCNFPVRKTLLEATRGFNPDGFPKDLLRYRGDGETSVTNYMTKNSIRAKYNPRASVYHTVSESRMSFNYFHERGFLQGISASYTDFREGINHDNFRIRYSFLRKLRSILKVSDMNHALAEFRSGYIKGYKFHREEVVKDPSLYEWVMKEDYTHDID